MIKQYKIPTMIGVFLLISGLAVGVFLVQRGTNLFGQAQGGITPEQLKITNVSGTSFSVSWITPKESTGFIAYGETSSLGSTANDDKDQSSGQTNNYFTHHITLQALKPSTKYYFKIGSGGKLYDNQGAPYTLTTAPAISAAPPLADTAHGVILQADGQPAKEAIVYLSMSGTTPLSAFLDRSGKWVINLSNARTTDLGQYTQYDQSAQVEEIFVQGGPGGVATALNTTSNDNPVPDITLGQTYDFRQASPQSTASTVTPTPSGVSGTPTPTSSKFSFKPLASPKENNQVAIINPSEKEKISTQTPEFSGTGPSGKKIKIIVQSPQYTSTVTVGDDGTWTWTPPTDLLPGEHKITITYLGKTISRTFTVLAATGGIQPAFTATQSGTITPTSTPTATWTPTPTPTATPSLLTPTATQSGTPKPTSTTARTGMPSTQSGIPKSGQFTPTFLIFAAGLLLILSGFITKLYWSR